MTAPPTGIILATVPFLVGFAAAETILVEDDNALIAYMDSFEWFSRVVDGAASGATYHFSNIGGNVASLTYTFRSFTYNTPRWSRPLKIQIRVDGKPFDVDLQDISVAPDLDQPSMLGPATLTSAPVFTFDGGSMKSRNIQILPGANSSIPMIVVDSFSFEVDTLSLTSSKTGEVDPLSSQPATRTISFEPPDIATAGTAVTTDPGDDSANFARSNVKIAAVAGASAAGFAILCILATILYFTVRFFKNKKRATAQRSRDLSQPTPYIGVPYTTSASIHPESEPLDGVGQAGGLNPRSSGTRGGTVPRVSVPQSNDQPDQQTCRLTNVERSAPHQRVGGTSADTPPAFLYSGEMESMLTHTRFRDSPPVYTAADPVSASNIDVIHAPVSNPSREEQQSH